MLKRSLIKIMSAYIKMLDKRKADKIASLIKSENKHKRFFLFQTPTHSNIGDHAIAEAQLDFLNANFPGHTVYELNQDLMVYFIEKYSSLINKNDIILLHGGGNFGNEYMREEKLRTFVIQNFPNNKIVVFPQTIHYSNDISGKKQLQAIQKLFAGHPNLTLTARENVSFDLMKEYFPSNKVILTPDIVLSQSQLKNQPRSYGLEVIRADQESILSNSDKEQVHQLLVSYFEQVINSDMHVEDSRTVKTLEKRKAVLEFKLSQFRSAKIVITDRLHGMVLAAITGTPCIVFSNYNQKVLGTYDWIKDLNYIRFVRDIEEAQKAFGELNSLESYNPYDSKVLESMYNPLIESLHE
ncbi:polysaccharide pyruvyl transferase family protein [Sphingobacterium siyangense]|uniref:polysaccharide pyruvyl transferase family protein n=1 Tax=Sphingobacterium siyangense TaxID=459529 RepID=UPI002010433F|nr:polysaccharide pyruvyl transferase family protein [Sphingobacterium siyangense]UQA75605.1 polysaccharide pyruvyl transferase family protein [Sphingobacterium siyangense]